MPHTWFLVPGFGAQGGAAAEIAGGFADDGLGAVINSSRGIIFAHRRKDFAQTYGDARWQGAVEAAAREMIDQLRDATSVGRL
jgi:orotidine-5'-phosphate decarboxylase